MSTRSRGNLERGAAFVEYALAFVVVALGIFVAALLILKRVEENKVYSNEQQSASIGPCGDLLRESNAECQ